MYFSRKKLLLLILLFSGAGTLGSLYYGYFGDPLLNIRDGILFSPERALAPCTLCWYARVFLYPIFILSVIATTRGYRQPLAEFFLSFSLLGLLTTVYHSSIQYFGASSILECGGGVSCSEIQVAYFGFITIPVLGAIAFFAICILSVLLKETEKELHESS